jgi:hypothetical protein
VQQPLVDLGACVGSALDGKHEIADAAAVTIAQFEHFLGRPERQRVGGGGTACRFLAFGFGDDESTANGEVGLAMEFDAVGTERGDRHAVGVERQDRQWPADHVLLGERDLAGPADGDAAGRAYGVDALLHLIGFDLFGEMAFEPE